MDSPSSNPIQEIGEAWAVLYPLINWVLMHPLASLVFLVLGLYLIWLILRGLIYLTEQFWLSLLNFPLWLLRRLWGQRQLPSFLRLVGQPQGKNESRDRLMDLIAQLEMNQVQQAELLSLAKDELQKLDQE